MDCTVKYIIIGFGIKPLCLERFTKHNLLIPGRPCKKLTAYYDDKAARTIDNIYKNFRTQKEVKDKTTIRLATGHKCEKINEVFYPCFA